MLVRMPVLLWKKSVGKGGKRWSNATSS
jgi:hypothetical protein